MGCKQLCKEMHNTFAEKATCLHVLIYIVFLLSVLIFTVSVLSVLRTGGSLEMYLFLGSIGVVMLALFVSAVLITYFQCCKKKNAAATPIPEGQFSGTNPIRSGAPIPVGATAPVLAVDRNGSFNGTNPLRN